MTSRKNTSGSDDAGQAEAQKRFDAEQEKGFRGVKADPTPNEAYTLQGVTRGDPTPESTRISPDQVSLDRSLRWSSVQRAPDEADATDADAKDDAGK